MAVNQNIPAAWDTYVTQTNLGLEVVPHQLYDTLFLQPGAVPGGGTPPNVTELRFFQQTNVTPDISNMKNSGMLANPEAMLIQALRFIWRIPCTGNLDLVTAQVAFANATVVVLQIGNKNYGPWPLWTMTSGIEMTGVALGSLDHLWPQTGGPLYPLFPNLMLSPLQPFTLYMRTTPPAPGQTAGLINFPAASGPVGLMFMFDGQLARSIQ